MNGREQNLTNAQFPSLNSHPTQNLAIYARGLSPRMRIENWELSIGQIDDHVPDIMRSCISVCLLQRFEFGGNGRSSKDLACDSGTRLECREDMSDEPSDKAPVLPPSIRPHQIG